VVQSTSGTFDPQPLLVVNVLVVDAVVDVPVRVVDELWLVVVELPRDGASNAKAEAANTAKSTTTRIALEFTNNQRAIRPLRVLGFVS
jgi:hypothetical protein